MWRISRVREQNKANGENDAHKCIIEQEKERMDEWTVGRSVERASERARNTMFGAYSCVSQGTQTSSVFNHAQVCTP